VVGGKDEGIAVDVTFSVVLMAAVVVSWLIVEVTSPVVMLGDVISGVVVDGISLVLLIGNVVGPRLAVEVPSPEVLIALVVCGLVIEVTISVVLTGTVVVWLVAVVPAFDVTGAVDVLSAVLLLTVISTSVKTK
jgi:hypothetical protein